MQQLNRHILVFAIGVLMLLARPYLIYQITGNAACRQNPSATCSLLQRLVKKKDDHHDEQMTIGTAELRSSSTFVHPQRRLLNMLSRLLQLLFPPFAATIITFISTISLIQRRRYQLVSCLLI